MAPKEKQAKAQKATHGTTQEELPQPSGAIVCPNCGSRRIVRDYERGELVCADCGLVIAEHLIDMGAEWRAYSTDELKAKARGGAPIKYIRPDKGLTTEIDLYNRDIRGLKISGKKVAQISRMRKWHKRSAVSTSIERNLMIALNELDRIASYLALSKDVREDAALLYRQVAEKGLVRGRLIENVVSAVLYATCRKHAIPRTLDEIAQVSGVDRKEIGRTFRFISHELGLKIPLGGPEQLIPRVSTRLKLPDKTVAKINELFDEAMKKDLVIGRGPQGVVAAIVYIACELTDEKRTQKDIADALGVTEVTIRNRYKEIAKELGVDV
ncbi:MAG: transcription initiation factor IIB [Candidatus Micrarchaeota archaeon]|nr:transcription initiation factor IIB [Candidatus Micrarchaeota archaeon]